MFVRHRYMLFANDIEPSVIVVSLKSHKFFNRDIFKIGNGTAYKVITRRGTFKWIGYKTKPGDSGSAVVNRKGELIGIVYGHRGDKPIYLRIKKEFIHEG